MQTDSIEICLSIVSLVQKNMQQGPFISIKGRASFPNPKVRLHDRKVVLKYEFLRPFVVILWCICLCVCNHSAVWRSEDNLLELAFSFCLVGPGNWTKVIGLGGKHLHPLSNLAWSYLSFSKNPFLKKIFSYSFNNWNFYLWLLDSLPTIFHFCMIQCLIKKN